MNLDEKNDAKQKIINSNFRHSEIKFKEFNLIHNLR